MSNTFAIFPLNFLCYQEIYLPGKFCYLLTSICKTSGLIDKFISWITGTFKRSFGVDAVLTTLSWGITLIVIWNIQFPRDDARVSFHNTYVDIVDIMGLISILPTHSLVPFKTWPTGQTHSAPLGVWIHRKLQWPFSTPHSSVSKCKLRS